MRAALFICLCVIACASARTIQWTGAAGNSLWSFTNNWDVNAVPTRDDDVIINPLGGSSITISTPSVARSVTLGGGSYRQTLTLVSSLAVGDGGFSVGTGSTLQIQTNNDLPFSSTGIVHARAGAVIVFQSGSVNGPGQYIVDSGAGITFSNSALKLIDNANITVHGETTIQPTTIQFARGGAFYNLGNLTAVGQINIFSTDKSAALFYSFGNFTYQGASTTAPLTFQVTSIFGDLNILSGAISFEDATTVVGELDLPQGATVTVQASLAVAWFRSIQGAGSFTVYSSTDVVSLNISWVTLQDSGSLNILGSSATKSLVVSGKLILGGGIVFTTTDVSIIAGTVTGTGRLSASGNFEIAASSVGNINNFISAEVLVAGKGYTTGFVQVLFADAGNLHVLSTGTFTVGAAATFAKQIGSPVITNDGTFAVQLPVGAVFTSYVDYQGANGNLIFVGGEAIFQGDKVVAGKVTITTTLVEFRTAETHFGAVSGTGSINVTAAPPSTSSFGDVSTQYFGVVNGNVSVASVSVATLEIFNGILNLESSSHIHTATIFDFYGGALVGPLNTQLSSSSLLLAASTPATLRGVKITARQFRLQPTTPSTAVLVENFASITTTST